MRWASLGLLVLGVVVGTFLAPLLDNSSSIHTVVPHTRDVEVGSSGRTTLAPIQSIPPLIFRNHTIGETQSVASKSPSHDTTTIKPPARKYLAPMVFSPKHRRHMPKWIPRDVSFAVNDDARRSSISRFARDVPVGDIRHIVNSSSVRVAPPNWRLPQGRTRFCRAADGAVLLGTSKLRRIDLPARNLVECSESEFTVRRCSKESCHRLGGCLLAIPSLHCQQPSIVVPFSNPPQWAMHDGFQEAGSILLSLSSDSSNYSGYPLGHLQQCADYALESHCTHAFQLLPADNLGCPSASASAGSPCTQRAAMVRCVAYRFHYYANSKPQPVASQPLFAFMHRSEWRPSLVRDDLRLVVLRGPERTFRVNQDGYGIPCMKVGVRRAYGELVPLDLRMDLQLTLRLSHCPNEMDGAAGSGVIDVLATRQLHWTSPPANVSAAFDLASADMELCMTWINFTDHIGCQLALEVSAEPQVISNGVKLPQVGTSVYSLIVYASDAVVLRREIMEGDDTPISHDCAPYLQRDECCVNGIVAAHIQRRAGSVSTYAMGSAHEHSIQKLKLSSPAHPCIRLIDGYMSSFEYHGVAAFPRLVVRMVCSDDEMRAFLQQNSTSHVRFTMLPSIPEEVLSIPLSAFANCSRGKLGVSNDEEAQPFTDAAAVSRDTAFLLFSIAVHESIDAVRLQLQNIRSFAPNSAVVLHVSPSWGIQLREIEVLNGTAHPLVFINPLRERSIRLVQLQLNSARYVAESHPSVPWTHVVLMASNELILRSGIEAYVGHYDMSTPFRPSFGPVISTLHSFLGGRPDPEFVDMETHDHGFNYWHLAKGDGGVRGEFALMRALRLFGMRRLSTLQIYTEGSFFNRSIAVGLSLTLDAFFNASHGDCIDSWLCMSEAFFYQLFQHACHGNTTILPSVPDLSLVPDEAAPPFWNRRASHDLLVQLRDARCGEKTSTMAWQSPYFNVIENDIRMLRCSPFAAPFAMKRFPRNPREPLRRVVEEIQLGSRRKALRDVTSWCDALWT